MPTPTAKAENKAMLGQNTELALTEWEKNQIKTLFKEFDAAKKGVDID